MADRSSNTAYLTVLDAVPLENVGWYARVLSQRDYASVIGEVTRFVDLGFSVVANETGGGKITLDAESPVLTGTLPLGETVPVVDQEALWQIIENGIVRAEFLAEDVVEDVIVDDDGRRGTIINGRSTACVLEWAKVLPEGMPSPTSTERTFNAHPMTVWRQLLLEAQADGFVTWVQPLFTAAEDSAGESWGAAQAVTVQAGEDLLSLLTRWCEQNEMSWRMLPGWKLQVFRNAGHHREHEVVFVQHRGQRKHDRTITRREIANVVYADGGDGGIAVAASTSSQAIWRKRAAWVSAGDSSDATGRSAVANATLAQTSQPRVSRSIQVPIDRPGRRPFIDFGVHDWITIELPDGSADSGANRVVGIAIEIGESGEVTGELTLQSKAEVQAVRLQRLIDKLGGGTSSGAGSESATPIPVSKALLRARLRDLTDVDALGIQAGDLLMWDGAKFVDATPVLNMLADVDTTAPPTAGDVLTFDQTTGLAGWAPPPAGSGGGVTDHGALTGLADDDHTQYAKTDGSRGDFAATTHLHTALAISDSTVTGRAVMTAADAPAARLTLGAAASAHSHAVGDLTATGTPSTTTYLRGDGSWATPAGGTTTLDGLTDVEAAGATAGDVLGFDGTAWGPVAASAGSNTVLTAPDGGTWKLSVANNGALSTVRLTNAQSYASLLADLGAARYWNLAETSGNFAPTIGIDALTVGATGLARGTAGPFGTGDGTMLVSAGAHTTPKAELGTTQWTYAIWLYGGGGTGFRAIVAGGGTYRSWYLQSQRLYPYGFSWNAQQGPALSAGRWYLLVVGSDPTAGVKYWLDGTLAYSHATPVEATTHATVARWGNDENESGPFNALMAHPATWNRLLTDAEVAQMWNYAN